MTEHKQQLENGAACPPEWQTGIHVWIALGKSFCILVLVLAVLIPVFSFV